jgi:hypothetical protein
MEEINNKKEEKEQIDEEKKEHIKILGVSIWRLLRVFHYI